MEETKACSKCKEVKPVSEFHKCSKSKDGFKPRCKECRNAEKRLYNLKNKDKLKEYSKVYNKTYYQENKEREKNRRHEYYYDNHKQCLDYAKNYREENRDIINKKNTKRKIEKRKTDPLEMLKHRIRNNITIGFKNRNYKKGSKTQEVLGCTFEFFRHYIESQFKDGMSWDRLSEIHLDHIVPLATAKTAEDVIRLNHYTNFQPLWAEDNIKKSDKIIEGIQFKIL